MRNTTGVGVGVLVGVAVGVSVAVGVGVLVGVAVGVGVGVDVAVGVSVGAGVGVTVGVWVAVGVSVAVGAGVAAGVLVAVGVAVGSDRESGTDVTYTISSRGRSPGHLPHFCSGQSFDQKPRSRSPRLSSPRNRMLKVVPRPGSTAHPCTISLRSQ
jgi:hypothetical protein